MQSRQQVLAAVGADCAADLPGGAAERRQRQSALPAGRRRRHRQPSHRPPPLVRHFPFVNLVHLVSSSLS